VSDPLAQWLDGMEAKCRADMAKWTDSCMTTVSAGQLLMLLDCVRAAALASDEIQSQHIAWPGEVDTLADALARLRRLAKGDA
jgi:hypothetical protein